MTSPSVNVLVEALQEAANRFNNQPNPEKIVGWGIGLVPSDVGTHGVLLLRDAGPAAVAPDSLSVSIDGASYSVRTRVIDLDGEFEPSAPVLTPGTVAPSPGAPISTYRGWKDGAIAGALALSPDGEPDLILTARHVLRGAAPGSPVYLGSEEIGTVEEDPFRWYYDVGIVRLNSYGAHHWENFTPDRTHMVEPIRSIHFDQLDGQALVFRPTQDACVPCRILAVALTVLKQTDDMDAPIRQVDMIMTTVCTSPGDSGSALFDAVNSILGVSSFRSPKFSFFTNAWIVANDPNCLRLMGG